MSDQTPEGTFEEGVHAALGSHFSPEEVELIQRVLDACNETWQPVVDEHVELLRLWYERWRGFVSGTPDEMHLRTRAILDAHGVKLIEPRFQT